MIGTSRLRKTLLAVAAAFTLLMPPTASAHTVQPVGTTVVQDVGPYQLAATVRIPAALPAQLSVDIAPQQPSGGPIAVQLWLVPAGAPVQAPAIAHVISGQGTIVAQFPVNDAGDYELALQVSGQNGSGEARVPLTVTVQSISWLVVLMLGALGACAVTVCGAMLLRLFLHRRRRTPSARTQLLLTSTIAGCALIALVAFVATQFIPAGGVLPTGT